MSETKQFGKGQRTVPAQKAQKWYPVDDESQPKKVSTPLCKKIQKVNSDGDAVSYERVRRLRRSMSHFVVGTRPVNMELLLIRKLHLWHYLQLGNYIFVEV